MSLRQGGGGVTLHEVTAKNSTIIKSASRLCSFTLDLPLSPYPHLGSEDGRSRSQLKGKLVAPLHQPRRRAPPVLLVLGGGEEEVSVLLVRGCLWMGGIARPCLLQLAAVHDGKHHHDDLLARVHAAGDR